MLNVSETTILLADSDTNYMRKIKEELEKDIAVKVVGMAESGKEALEKLEEQKPDILLMDVLLGEKDGFWLLENLNKKEIDCVCIIVSYIGTDAIVKKAMDLGAFYYIAKPIDFDILAERVMQIFALSQMTSFSSLRRTELESIVSYLLNSMSITASIKGYHFIREGVIMVLEDKGAILSVTKGLYPDIAKKYNTTAGRVERAIRHAVETAWKRSGKKVYCEMAGYDLQVKPTNSQFIATMSEYIRVRQS